MASHSITGSPSIQSSVESDDPEHLRVGIIGGGIAGLAAAHHLERRGAHVTLFEASDQLGGLGTYFQYGGLDFERFYHVMLPTDRELLALMADLGLDDRAYWTESSFAMMHSGRIHPLNGPVDLLRFTPVSLLDRMRLGWTGIAGGLVRDPAPLDDITAETWLSRLSGPRAFAHFWRPLLEAKFGSAWNRIPAAWYWGRFKREKPRGKEVKGYPRGGYRALAESMAASLRTRGVQIRMSSPVERLDLDAAGRPHLVVDGSTLAFDRVLSTVPMVLLDRMAGPDLRPHIEALGPGVDYQGVVNVVLLLDRSVLDHYWLAVVESGVPFRGVVESTCVRSIRETGGRHLVYLLNYVHRTDPAFSEDEESIRSRYLDGFFTLFPEIPREALEASFVFRTPFVEPIYTTGYARRRPPAALVPGAVYLSTTAQIYPDVTSWNSAAGQARRTVEEMVAGAAVRP